MWLELGCGGDKSRNGYLLIERLSTYHYATCVYNGYTVVFQTVGPGAHQMLKRKASRIKHIITGREIRQF